MKDEYTDKRVIFKANAKRYLDFRIRCDYEGISQSKFFRLMIEKMIEQEPKILDIVDEWKRENESTTKRRQRAIDLDRAARAEFETEFAISDEEIASLYDLFDE